ncbi:MAG: hypothetical protein K0Q59_5002, partial [Paenibacillus sp.]|nr:hypothetical protein [Paenibacillus sp.]
HYPRQEIGLTTIEAVIKHLNTGDPLTNHTLKHELFVRSSTGKARD